MVVDGRKKFSCSCGHEFDFKNELVSHVRGTHGTERVNWICTFCNAKFLDSTSLRHHYRHVHKLLVPDQGARVEVHAIQQLNVIEEEGDEEVVMADALPEQQGDGDVEIVPHDHGIENENVNIQQRIRSAVLEMSSTLTGRLRVTETAMNFIF